MTRFSPHPIHYTRSITPSITHHPVHPIQYTPSSTPHPVHPIQYLHPLAGESGFDLGPEFRKKGFLLVAFMGLVQMIPLALIRHQKRLKAAAEQQAQKLN
jgi:hypothetical protein